MQRRDRFQGWTIAAIVAVMVLVAHGRTVASQDGATGLITATIKSMDDEAFVGEDEEVVDGHEHDGEEVVEEDGTDETFIDQVEGAGEFFGGQCLRVFPLGLERGDRDPISTVCDNSAEDQDARDGVIVFPLPIGERYEFDLDPAVLPADVESYSIGGPEMLTELTAQGIQLLIAISRPTADAGVTDDADEEAGEAGVYVVNADGSDLTHFPDPYAEAPAWSPDGTRLAYHTYGVRDVIVVTDRAGTTRTELAASLPVVLSWSPDGSRIAFLAYTDDYSGYMLWVVAVDGSGATKLADAGQAYPSPPAWSPDGTRIAFAGPGTGGSDVWVINADGTDPRQVTDLPGEVLGPTWSPDGSRIAFGEETRDDPTVEGYQPLSNALYVMNVDGSELTTLTSWQAPEGISDDVDEPQPAPTTDTTAIQSTPAWSPDSARLAFATIGGLAIIAVDGSGLVVFPAEEFQVRDPSWSPDGTRITFGGAPWEAEFDPAWDTYDDLYVINADGTGLVKVAAAPLVDVRPVWSPDGTTIAFMSESPGN